jgi:hypothetical protein
MARENLEKQKNQTAMAETCDLTDEIYKEFSGTFINSLNPFNRL